MAKKKAALKTKYPSKAKQVCFLELKIGPTLYHGAGADATEALDSLIDATPLEVQKSPKTKGILTVTKDGKAKQRLMYPVQLRRLFLNKISRIMWAKTLASMIG